MDAKCFIEDVLKQRRDKLRLYFHSDAIIRWHCTNEQFTVDEFISANCDYPGDWDGEIERIEHFGDRIVIVTKVYPTDRVSSYHVVSFLSLVNEKISRLDEYWADDGEAPEWRKKMGIGKPIG